MVSLGSYWLRLCLATVGGVSLAAVAVPPAWAQDDDEEDDGDEEDGDGAAEDEEEEEEEGQPAVTAGGLFTRASYPLSVVARPLTMTKGMFEAKVGLGADLSAQTAFETFGLLLDARFGLEDNVELQAGFKGIYNFDIAEAYLGFKGSLSYDLVDFRAAARLPLAPEANFLVDLGFPFRYAPKPQVAIVGLETLMTIRFDGKPDLSPSLGVIIQPIDLVALLLRGQVIIPEFNTDLENFVWPATIGVQLAASSRFDVGMEFTLLNLNPPPETDINDPTMSISPGLFDQRFLIIYATGRL